MSEGAFLELIVLASAAGGLVLFGASRLFLASHSLSVQFLAAVLACAVPALGPLALGYSSAALIPVLVVAIAELVTAMIGAGRSAQVMLAGLRRFRQPGLQAGILSATGGAILIVSLARFDGNVEAALDRDLAFMTEVTWKPPLTEVAGVNATTDRGRHVAIWETSSRRGPREVVAAEFRALNDTGCCDRVIRTAPANEVSNCHGWVFTGGRHWLGPEDVQNILTDNGYLPTSSPRPGDLTIYRADDKILHSAVVQTTLENGVVLVESKWGWMGVFIHRVNDSCYGQSYTFYRSPRQGHLIAGLDHATESVADRLIGQGP